MKFPTLTSLNSRFKHDRFCRRAVWDEKDKDPHRAGLQPTHALFGEERNYSGCCNCRGEAHSQSKPLHMTCCLQSFFHWKDGERNWSLPEPFQLPMERPQADQQRQVFGSGEMSCGTLCLMSSQSRLHK